MYNFERKKHIIFMIFMVVPITTRHIFYQYEAKHRPLEGLESPAGAIWKEYQNKRL